ncbi:ATP-binding protein [Arthrobacter methylotrophus]|uniref:ATP-binding protein n=1 Tax=Arthrobacter methylotrophus TaxID=121291 RepID=A0ABV5UQ61_9MICC
MGEFLRTVIKRPESHSVGNTGIFLKGLRGVGKTALLNEFSEMARRHGWLMIRFEAEPGNQPYPSDAIAGKLTREFLESFVGPLTASSKPWRHALDAGNLHRQAIQGRIPVPESECSRRRKGPRKRRFSQGTGALAATSTSVL